MRRFLAVLMILAALPAAAAPRALHLQQLPGQEIQYADGVGWVTTGRDIRVAASITPDSRKRAWMTFVIWNNSSRPITVKESAITVEANSRRLKTFTAEELFAAERRRQGWEKFGAAMAAGLNSYSAAQQGRYSATGTYQGNYSASTLGGPRVTGTTSGTLTLHGTDPVAQQQAIASAGRANQALIADLQAQQARRSQALEQRLLRANTIAPGSSHGGDVAIELPPRGRGPTPVGVQFWIDNEPHTFFVFADAPPTPAMLQRIAQLPSQGPGPATAEVSASRATVQVAAPVQPTTRNATQTASSVPPPDARSLAAAKLMLSEAANAVSRGLVERGQALAAQAGSSTPKEIQALLREPEKLQKMLFEFVIRLGDETRLMSALESRFAAAMSYEELMASTEFFRSPAGQRLLALSANGSAFEDLGESFAEISDERIEAIFSQMLAAYFPAVSWNDLSKAVGTLAGHGSE